MRSLRRRLRPARPSASMSTPEMSAHDAAPAQLRPAPPRCMASYSVDCPASQAPSPTTALVTEPKWANASRSRAVGAWRARRGVGDDERGVEEVGRAAARSAPTSRTSSIELSSASVAGERAGQLDDRAVAASRVSDRPCALTARAQARPEDVLGRRRSRRAGRRPPCPAARAASRGGPRAESTTSAWRSPSASCSRLDRSTSMAPGVADLDPDQARWCAPWSSSRATLNRLSWNSSAISTLDRPST